MNPSRWPAAVAVATCLAVVSAAGAQPSPPRIGYACPAGGRQGTTFPVTLGGQYLAAEATVGISGAGVQAKVVEYTKPLNQKQVNELRERVKELQTKPKEAETVKEIADIRAKLLAYSKKAGPAIAETVTLQVTVSPDAAPGERELRLVTPGGVSNPLVFCVGQLPEFREEEPKGRDAPPGRDSMARRPPPRAPEIETAVTLPAVVNGQIMPGDVDRFRFQARKGQRLVVAACARGLIPYLADAVPGWFQATLALYDARHNEVAFNDNYRFHPDPVLAYDVPEDGDYVLEIRDAIWRGREDFVYRVALGELPFVTGIFPLGGKAGDKTTVELTGWNLPVTRLTRDNGGPGIHPVSVRQGDLVSNGQPFAVDTLPECLEKEPNDLPDAAQAVALPVIVNGRVDRPGDADVFRFEGRAGDEVVAEVWARRLDSPLDSTIRLTDAAGRQLAFNDDHEDKGSGLNTHHADSWLCAALPADGTYYLHLADAQRQGGPAYAYRVRIGPPRPDFELRVAPSSVNVRGGASVPLTVYALRRDGFAGEITLALKDAPEGFALAGARLPAGQDQVRLTLTVPPTPPKEPVCLGLEGRAAVQGREVVRPAVPAEDMMQAFAYRHLVPAEALTVAVSGRSAARAPVRIFGDMPLRIPAGQTARVAVGMPTSTKFGTIQFELSEPPDGIAIRDSSPDGFRTRLVLESDAAKVKPGLKGNLIVNTFLVRTETQDGKPLTPPRRTLLGSLPAIPFEIVAP